MEKNSRDIVIDRVMSDGDYDKRGPVVKAVDKAIEKNGPFPDNMYTDYLDRVVDHIRETEEYWQ